VSPRVSALVVTWNSERDVEACLAAVRGQVHEVVVVDNASSDGTPDLLRAAEGPGVQVVLSSVNTGYARGNLLAAERATGELLLLLNPDCAVEPGAVAGLVRHLEEHPSCAAASALLLEPDGGPQMFARHEATLATSVPWFCSVPALRDARRGGPLRARREYRDLLSNPPAEPFAVDVPAAACVLVRRAAAQPLLDPAFPLFFNDVDLYRRLRSAGHDVVVVPEARARHGHGRSHRQLPGDVKRAEQLLSLRAYARRWWGRPRALLLDVVLLLDVAAASVLVLLRRPGWRQLTEQRRGTLGALGLPGGVTPLFGPGSRRTV
jgi:N-acetylglucosaminyl-diphospho-decaprenol L-rhamnosyltransferase